MHVAEVQVAVRQRDLSRIIKYQESHRAFDSAVILGLHQKRVWPAESIIFEGAKRRLVINVAASDGFLEIKRDGMRGAFVRQGDFEASCENTVQAAVTVFPFRKETVAEVEIETAKGIVPGRSILEMAIAEAVVQLEPVREQVMDVRKNLVVKKIRLRSQSRGCLFGVDVLDGNHLRGGYTAHAWP